MIDDLKTIRTCQIVDMDNDPNHLAERNAKARAEIRRNKDGSWVEATLFLDSDGEIKTLYTNHPPTKKRRA